MIKNKGFDLKWMWIVALKGICTFSWEENWNGKTCSPSDSRGQRPSPQESGWPGPPFLLPWVCGGTSISEKLLAPHPIPLQVRDLLDLERWTRPWSSQTLPLSFCLGICSPSWMSLWLRGKTCHWVGESVWFSPAFVNVKLTFSSPHIWLPVTLSMRSELLGEGTRYTRGSGRPQIPALLHTAQDDGGGASILPISQMSSPNVYNTPLFSLF